MINRFSLMAYKLEAALLEPDYFARSRSLPVPVLQAQSGPDRHEQRTLLDRRVLSGAGQDNAIRWRKGERLDHLFEHCSERFKDRPAVITENGLITYQE